VTFDGANFTGDAEAARLAFVPLAEVAVGRRPYTAERRGCLVVRTDGPLLAAARARRVVVRAAWAPRGRGDAGQNYSAPYAPPPPGARTALRLGGVAYDGAAADGYGGDERAGPDGFVEGADGDGGATAGDRDDARDDDELWLASEGRGVEEVVIDAGTTALVHFALAQLPRALEADLVVTVSPLLDDDAPAPSQVDDAPRAASLLGSAAGGVEKTRRFVRAPPPRDSTTAVFAVDHTIRGFVQVDPRSGAATPFNAAGWSNSAFECGHASRCFTTACPVQPWRRPVGSRCKNV